MKRLALLFCAAGLFMLTGEPAAAQDFDSSYGNLRMLIKKSSRQYMMYQYGVGALTNTRAPLLGTIDEFNEGIARIRRGDAFSDQAPPQDPALARYLDQIEERWARLEDIYTFQPYKLYLHKEMLPLGERKDDPVLVRYVDRLAEELLQVFSDLISDFREYCDAQSSTACSDLLLETGRQLLLVESIATDLVFAHLDVDRKKRVAAMREKVAEFEANLEAMRAPDHFVDNPPELVGPVIDTIDAYWKQLSVYIDMALDGDAEDIDLDLMLRSENRLLDEFDNLVSIIGS